MQDMSGEDRATEVGSEYLHDLDEYAEKTIASELNSMMNFTYNLTAPAIVVPNEIVATALTRHEAEQWLIKNWIHPELVKYLSFMSPIAFATEELQFTKSVFKTQKELRDVVPRAGTGNSMEMHD